MATQPTNGEAAAPEDCIEQAQKWGARIDLVILLVRHELPLRKHDLTGLYGHLAVNVLASHNGGIYNDDVEALEALNLVAQD